MRDRGPTSEKGLLRMLRRNLGTRGVHFQRVETAVGSGVPDVNFCILGTEGWLELKHWRRKSKRAPFIIPTLRATQVAWLKKRRDAGGHAYILCQMNNEIMLFDGADAAELIRQISWDRARELAIVWLEEPIDWELLARALHDPSQVRSS